MLVSVSAINDMTKGGVTCLTVSSCCLEITTHTHTHTHTHINVKTDVWPDGRGREGGGVRLWKAVLHDVFIILY